MTPILAASSCSSSESGVLTNRPITPFGLCLHSIPSPSVIHSLASLAFFFNQCIFWSCAGSNVTLTLQLVLYHFGRELERWQIPLLVTAHWQQRELAFPQGSC